MQASPEKKKAITLDGELSGAEWVSAFNRNVLYDTSTAAPHFRKEFDVLHYLPRGRNVAGGIVGNGFYNVDTESAWDFNRAPWRNCPAFLCQIDIEYPSGKIYRICNDHTWKLS